MYTIKFRAWDKKRKKMEEIVFLDKEHVPSMQYTCLKDKNDKEIYEGDFFTIDGVEGLWRVIWFEGCWTFQTIPGVKYSGKIPHFILARNEGIEVIGNTYEKPRELESVS